MCVSILIIFYQYYAIKLNKKNRVLNFKPLIHKIISLLTRQLFINICYLNRIIVINNYYRDNTVI